MKETYSPTIGAPGTGKIKDPLPPVALTALQAIQTTHLYPRGFEFFLEGQSAEGIYILYAGRIELSVTDDRGRQMVLATALPGDILGLSAVVSGKHYEETAAAAVPCQVGFVKCKDFLGFLSHHPEAAFWVVQLLSEQVTATLEQLSCVQRAPSRVVRQ